MDEQVKKSFWSRLWDSIVGAIPAVVKFVSPYLRDALDRLLAKFSKQDQQPK